jgi:hypothetical protein
MTDSDVDSAPFNRSGGVNLDAQQVNIAGDVVGRAKIIERIYLTDPGNIQKVAADQIALLASYYQAVLAQANRSFTLARNAAIIGLLFFLAAIGFLLVTNSSNLALVSSLAGAFVEVIAGIVFALYGKTTAQLADFHQRLDQTQHFLLANSICEALEGEIQQKTRSDLVMTIATASLPSTKATAAEIQTQTKS